MHNYLPPRPEIDPSEQKHILPLAFEFIQAFENFSNDINKWNNHGDNNLQDLIEKCNNEIIKHSKAAQKNITIDTYARKLFLTKGHDDLRELKILLDIYLIYTQIKNGVEKRYDAFFATLLEGGGEEKISLPEIINIITWNFDFQLEMALSTYFNRNYLDRFGNGKDHWRFFEDEDYIFKINGSAMRTTSSDKRQTHRVPYVEIDLYGDEIETNKLREIQKILLERYDMITKNTDIKPTISFAWEKIEDSTFLKNIETRYKNTRILVVIGYSFPTFNRKIDIDILANMPKLEKIIIQSPSEEDLISIENRLLALLALYRKALLKANPDGYPGHGSLDKKIKSTTIQK